MKYSEENLMKLISQASHQARHNGQGKHEDHENPGHEENDRKQKHGDRDSKENGKVGYPNCPGPGCGDNCPYKGTEECPKVAARAAGGEDGQDGHGSHGEHGGHGEHSGHGEHGEHGGHSEHGEHGGHGGHGGHGEHGEHGGHGEHGAREPMSRERILTLLDEEGAVSQNALAARLQIRPQSVSELLGKLEKDGYIVRTQNEQDKREFLVSLSEAGKQRADEVKDLQQQQAAEFLAPLDEDEKQTLFALLTKLTGGTVEK